VFGISASHVRAAASVVAASLLGGGINDSTSDHSHRLVTYFFWYGVAGLFVLIVIALTIRIERRNRSKPPDPPQPPPPSPRRMGVLNLDGGQSEGVRPRYGAGLDAGVVNKGDGSKSRDIDPKYD
jgi:hypothetical protein